MNYFKKALSFLLTFLLLSQHSFSMENEKEDPSHIIKLFEEHHKKNPELLNSSKEKDIVVFLGKTGSGKSTLINYLSDKELKGTNKDRIILNNPSDHEAMEIGETYKSQTFLPKYIQHNNLLFCDLPGFGDTGGTAKDLLNACFIKNIIENSKTARLVFVAGYNEVTAARGELFKKLLLITEKLIPNEKIEDFSSLVITKTKPEIDNKEFIEDLKNDVDVELITPWINKESLTQMSLPLKTEVNQKDKENIIKIILKTTNKKINNINISAVYDEKEKNNIRKIYDKKIEDIADFFVKEKININNISSLDVNKLQINKQYFQTNCLNDVILSIENAPLIKLLRPVSEEIYISSFNEAKKNIFLKISQIEEKINVEIKEQQNKKLEEEKKEEENKRIQEENRRKQVEEQLRQKEILRKEEENRRKQIEEKLRQEEKLRKEQENKRIQEENKRKQVEEQLRLQIEDQKKQQLIYQQNLEHQRLVEQENKRIQEENKRKQELLINEKIEGWYSTGGGLALVTFNNKLLLAHQGREQSIHIGSSDDGKSWKDIYKGEWTNLKSPVTWKSSEGGIAMTVFNSKLFLVHQGGNKSIHLASSYDGIKWTYIEKLVGWWGTDGGISMTVFNNKLFLLWVNSDQSAYFASSSDGETWPKTATQIPGTVISGIAMTVFNNGLFSVAQAKADKRIWNGYSNSGEKWSGDGPIPNYFSTDGGLSVVPFNNKLFLANQNHKGEIILSSSNDGKTWYNSKKIANTSEGGISMTIFNNKIFLVYQGCSNGEILVSSLYD